MSSSKSNKESLITLSESLKKVLKTREELLDDMVVEADDEAWLRICEKRKMLGKNIAFPETSDKEDVVEEMVAKRTRSSSQCDSSPTRKRSKRTRSASSAFEEDYTAAVDGDKGTSVESFVNDEYITIETSTVTRCEDDESAETEEVSAKEAEVKDILMKMGSGKQDGEIHFYARESDEVYVEEEVVFKTDAGTDGFEGSTMLGNAEPPEKITLKPSMSAVSDRYVVESSGEIVRSPPKTKRVTLSTNVGGLPAPVKVIVQATKDGSRVIAMKRAPPEDQRPKVIVVKAPQSAIRGHSLRTPSRGRAAQSRRGRPPLMKWKQDIVHSDLLDDSSDDESDLDSELNDDIMASIDKVLSAVKVIRSDMPKSKESPTTFEQSSLSSTAGSAIPSYVTEDPQPGSPSFLSPVLKAALLNAPAIQLKSSTEREQVEKDIAEENVQFVELHAANNEFDEVESCIKQEIILQDIDGTIIKLIDSGSDANDIPMSLLDDKNMDGKGVKSFSCCECGAKFTSHDYLMFHIQKHHSENEELECWMCDGMFKHLATFNNHMRTRHSLVPEFTCSLCGNNFFTSDHLLQHKQDNHSSITCPHCDKDLANYDAAMRKNHFILHSYPEAIQCEVCERVFMSIKGLNRHLEDPEMCERIRLRAQGITLENMKVKAPKKQYEIRDDDMDAAFDSDAINEQIIREMDDENAPKFYRNPEGHFVCKYCHQKFTAKHNLLAHINRSHTGNLEFPCRLCNKAYARRDMLNTHLESKHKLKRPHVCNHGQCSRRFFTIEELEEHKQCHSEVMECPICDKDLQRMTSYLRKQHLSNCQGERNYECKGCMKRFGFQRSYQRHITLHCPVMKERADTSDELLKLAVAQKSNEKRACHECDRVFTSDYFLNLHVQTVHKADQQEYFCSLCNRTFTSHNGFTTHLRSIHEIEFPFMCEICKKRFSMSSDFLEHMLTHAQLAPDNFRCNLCNRDFTDGGLEALKNHILVDHPGPMGIKCVECDKLFTNKKVLARHMQRHKKFQYLCPRNGCCQSFNDEVLYENHLKGHEGCGPFCTLCNKRFSTHGALKWHMTAMHTKDYTPHDCAYCGRTFRRIYELKAHIKMKHMSEDTFEYSCSFCTKKYALKSQLKQHMKWHSSERPYICNQCGRGFFSQWKLDEHSRIHTGVKEFQCQYCNKCFSKKNDCQRHERIHTGDRPFACEVCDKRFSDPSARIKHQRQHEGVLPFRCLACDAGFMNRLALEKHKAVHLDEKLYPCKLCDRSFVSQYVLNNHERKLHQKGNIESKFVRCKICSKLFLANNYLIHHMKNIHELPDSMIEQVMSGEAMIVTDDNIEGEGYVVTANVTNDNHDDNDSGDAKGTTQYVLTQGSSGETVMVPVDDLPENYHQDSATSENKSSNAVSSTEPNQQVELVIEEEQIPTLRVVSSREEGNLRYVTYEVTVTHPDDPPDSKGTVIQTVEMVEPIVPEGDSTSDTGPIQYMIVDDHDTEITSEKVQDKCESEQIDDTNVDKDDAVSLPIEQPNKPMATESTDTKLVDDTPFDDTTVKLKILSTTGGVDETPQGEEKPNAASSPTRRKSQVTMPDTPTRTSSRVRKKPKTVDL